MGLTIHGFEIECASLKRRPDLVGADRRRAPGGQMRSTRVAKKIIWDGATSILDPATMAPIESLLYGEGHVWSFDEDVYSSKGLGFSTVPTLDATNKKFGASAMSAASNTTYTANVTDAVNRTILYWRRPGSGSFNAYGIVANGASITLKYKSGAPTAETVTNWMTLAADGSFSLLGKDDAGANAVVQYDDVVILPFAATAAMLVAWAAQTIAWADLPALNVGGNLIKDGTSTIVEGEPGAVTNIQAVSPLDNTLKDNLQTLAFSLYEV